MTTTITQQINEELVKFQESLKDHNLYAPVKYILQLDGKRIRPALLLQTVEAFGGNTDDAIPLALAVEVFHNFTLLHDDIMDKSDLRRGKPTVHKKWDENAAILSGDVMLILAYQLIEDLPIQHQPKILKAFNKMAVWLCEGQQDDMDFEKRDFVDLPEYLEMIKNKTSVLLAFCLKAGAILSNADETSTKNIYQYGLNLGLAFQLQDDYLDLYPKSVGMGKVVGGDILNRKKALPLLLGLKSENKEEIISILNAPNNEETVSNTIKAFEKVNIKESCEKLINEYYTEADKYLSQINDYPTEIFNNFTRLLKGREK